MNGIIPLILSLLLFAPPAAAEIYRWQDSEGSVHFGDTPPKSDRATLLYEGEAWSPEGSPAGKAGLRPGERRALSQSRRRAGAARQGRSKPTRSTRKSDRKARCIKSRKQVGRVSETLRKGYKAGRGTALKRKRKELEAWIFDNCETRWR